MIIQMPEYFNGQHIDAIVIFEYCSPPELVGHIEGIVESKVMLCVFIRMEI